jgi:histidyl-tRNA synthetase
MALSTQPYKGARDFYPEDKRLQKYMFGKLRQVVERYGYEEYDAPILESIELYLVKSGAEIVNEQTYTFTDRGGREVVIRPEMTPTVSRMVAAKRQELSYPLRWYSIPNLWRYERPQRGRLREHWQLNVDVFGLAGSEAEFELIQMADALYKGFGAKPSMYEIRLNSRRLMDYILQEYLGLTEVEAQAMAKLIDRLHKLDRSEFIALADVICSSTEREAGVVEKLLTVLDTKNLQDLPALLREHASVAALQELLRAVEDSGVPNVHFDVTVMRGFDYYTDVVFEVVDTHPDNNRAMMGGGRYDGLVGLFGVEPVPTVGFGLGDVTLANFLELHNLLPKLHSETDVYVATVGDTAWAAQAAIAELREMGLNVAVGLAGRKLADHFKIAEKKNIHYVVIIGEQELADEQYTLKNLGTTESEKHSLQRIVSIVKDYREVKSSIK